MKPTPPMVDLSTYRQGDYDPGPWARRAAWVLVSMIFLEGAFPWPQVWKKFLLWLFGARVAAGVVVKPRLRIKFPWKLSVGRCSWIGEDVWIDNLASVTIGAHACLSQGARVMTGNHDRTSSSFDLRLGPIDIGDGAWVGAGALLCPGTRMETHAVLNVGAVAKGVLEADGIYAGNPAARIGTRIIEPKPEKP